MNKKNFLRAALRWSFITCFIVIGFSVAAVSWINSGDNRAPSLDEMLSANEYYEYDVRYGFIRLGSVYVTVTDTLVDEKPLSLISAQMVSNSNIPFVGYREYHFNSIVEFDGNELRTPYFWVDKIHRDISPFNSYEFDYENGLIYSFEHPAKHDTLSLDQLTYGGPELLLYSRAHSGVNNEHVYHIAIDNEVRKVYSTYTDSKNTIRSRIHSARVPAYRTDGFADLDGPFGFSGNFQGYSSVDGLRLPLETKLNVWIGSAVIRLVHFEQNSN